MSDSGSDSSILYHYTNAAGLIGIVKPSSWDIGVWPELEKQLAAAAQLRASDVRYMNDSQELKFGAKFFVARLVAAAADSSLSGNTRQACDRLATVFSTDDVFNWELRCFAACFCQDGDRLSQWRGYAGGAGGYAIGFSRDALAHRSYALAYSQTMQTDIPWNADLQPVKYGAAEAEAAADRFIDEMRNPEGMTRAMIDGHRDPAHQARTQAMGVQWLAAHALRAIVGVKDDGFQEELEWRLFYLGGDPRHPVKIRIGTPGIVPYLTMAVNMRGPDEDTIPPTIDKLVVGPGHNQRSQIAAARELMKACGHNPDVVEPSKLSFTG